MHSTFSKHTAALTPAAHGSPCSRPHMQQHYKYCHEQAPPALTRTQHERRPRLLKQCTDALDFRYYFSSRSRRPCQQQRRQQPHAAHSPQHKRWPRLLPLCDKPAHSATVRTCIHTHAYTHSHACTVHFTHAPRACSRTHARQLRLLLACTQHCWKHAVSRQHQHLCTKSPRALLTQSNTCGTHARSQQARSHTHAYTATHAAVAAGIPVPMPRLSST